MMDDYGDRVVLGFVMTTIAGLATAVGSALSFCLPKYNGKVFAVCLSLSAGVMFYVSFGEILKKSIDEFAESVSDEGQAYAYATTCFFAGILAAILLDYTLHVMFKWNHPEPEAPSNRNPVPDTMPKSAADRQHQQQQEEEHNTHTQPDPGATDVRLCACDAKPLTVAIAQSLCGGGGEEGNEDGQTRTPPTDNDNEDAENPPDQASSASEDNVTTETNEGSLEKQWEADKVALKSLGLFSGIALAMHNFPEGLATFAATLADPTFGLGVAVAIAIHNIPEGIAVSVPIFYATGSKWQAFGWSLLSGIAEPIGALLGYLVLMNVMSSMAFAILFGLVGGIMIHICIKKLIPTSLRYDPHDRVTSNTCLLGMAVMALSLVLFQVL
uniref:Zinc transporter n=1 Tax=Vitrella brassicaformis TaxID=1169539 RepID=A0A7S1P0N3_9ALVE|mmetsp:Transcript_21278/g.52009  ORF Transcript_21278/g.52009 Transcript_21278/m.52009 type:complete len:384 (+) Transcript_21278:312-1463(+)